MCSALVATPADIDRRRSGLAFARRVYVPRMIGLGLGFFMSPPCCIT